MKTLMCTLLCALAALGAALPCQSTAPGAATFEELDPGAYRQLAYDAKDHGAVVLTAKSGECLEVRAVGTGHMRSLQKRAVSLAESVVLDFQGQDCRRLSVLLGADTFDPSRVVELACYEQGDVLRATMRVQYTFGPLSLWNDQAGFTMPGAILGLDVSQDAGSQPIDYCELTGADGVFLSRLWYRFETIGN